MEKGGKIYLLLGKDELAEMNESTYHSEDVLQGFLASHPDLLAGEQIHSEAPRRWLLIKREIGIPGAESEGERWSLDHLFVDQDGVPTFVECKRSADTRIRREVVGQMLDYAANAITYWPMEKLRQSAAETAIRVDRDLNELILSLLELSEAEDKEGTIEDFWNKVEGNLQSGRLRLLFVSDHIPSELRRVVEFLNQQMSETEVIALEVKQYKGSGQTALVPRVLGLSESAQKRKEQKTPRILPWTKNEFLENLHARSLPEDLVEVVLALLELGEQLQSERLVELSWGKGRDSGSYSFKHRGSNYLSVFSYGSINLNMGHWKQPMEFRDELASELGKKLDFDLKYDLHAYPNISSEILKAQNGVRKLEEWLRYAIQTSGSPAEDS